MVRKLDFGRIGGLAIVLYVNHFLDFTTYLIVITDLEESRELEQDTTGNKGDGACFPWQITTTGRNGCWSRYLG